MDRGKQGTERSPMTDANGVPVSVVIARAHRHDSRLLRPTLEELSNLDLDLGAGLLEKTTRALLNEFGRQGGIRPQPLPAQPLSTLAGMAREVVRIKNLPKARDSAGPSRRRHSRQLWPRSQRHP